MSKAYSFSVDEKFAGSRLDTTVITLHPKYTRSYLKAAKITATVNGKPSKWGYKLHLGDFVEFIVPDLKPLDVLPQDIPFDVLYSDNDIAVVNKPYGVPVHPSHGHPDGTLVNGLLFHFGDKLSGIGGVERPGIVHRLDKDTAGLMVIALNDVAHHHLSRQFMDREVRKIYHAIVKGNPPAQGRLEHPLGRAPGNPLKRAVVPLDKGGKAAITDFRVIEYLTEHAYVAINLLTGRTHQIRIHFAYEGFPIAGDPLYSRHHGAYSMNGIALCAKELRFRHPVTGDELSFTIELPAEFTALLDKLRKR
ncbi:MAG: RluA family pseudouridine synthase [Brevinematales bacterium]|nr:RluA family pseudouridine synthase [Brevinematales bacterium]